MGYLIAIQKDESVGDMHASAQNEERVEEVSME